MVGVGRNEMEKEKEKEKEKSFMSKERIQKQCQDAGVSFYEELSLTSFEHEKWSAVFDQACKCAKVCKEERAKQEREKAAEEATKGGCILM